jgi:23S rRNA pseudouridine955/2504/2580 synthase
MNILRKDPRRPAQAASQVEVTEEDAGQRIDNFLIRILKGVPKSHIYRLLRTGQVRVNSRRTDATYRVQADDRVRLPPVRTAPAKPTPERTTAGPTRLAAHVLFEDDVLIALNKPPGLAAHGGSGVSSGAIESMRAERPELRFLELVHRLDRDTSGVLLLAKKRSALKDLHAQLRAGNVQKEYLALVKGRWTRGEQHVRLSLNRYLTPEGERRVSVARDGTPSYTVFRPVRAVNDYTLLSAELMTGRTHQIRVHLAHLGFPIVGDEKYGDFALNKALRKHGLKRMFLHAERVRFKHPVSGEPLTLEAPLAADLEEFLRNAASSAGAARSAHA